MHKRIGQLAVEGKCMTDKAREKILEKQKELRSQGRKKEDTLFGELAQQEGLIQQTVIEILLLQQKQLNTDFTEEKTEKKLRQTWGTIADAKTLDFGDAGATYKGKHASAEEKTVTNLPLLTLANAITIDFSKNSSKVVESSADTLDSMSTLPVKSTDSSDTLDTVSGAEDATVFMSKHTGNAPAGTRYEIIDEIARGGMGVVFRGTQSSLQRAVAIKKMLAGERNPDKKAKFIAESKVTAYLDHPNIVPVYELGESEDGEIFLAMKLVGGTEWKDLLHPTDEKKQKLAEKYDLEAHLGILLNVCNAIAFAHSKHITHNDLKLSNVMVGEFSEVLVMHWGIAINICKEKSSDACTLHKSEISSPMGTPSYMPPELAEGHGNDIGPWTDIYLLGGILCEILSGKPPHKGTPLMALVSSVMGKLPKFNDTMPQELRDICCKALAREIKDRYQSVKEFKHSIEDFLKHRESIAISDKAQKTFNNALEIVNKWTLNDKFATTQLNILYQNLSIAIAGFQQALTLWGKNTNAIEGEKHAKDTYIKLAINNEDLGLAESLISERDISCKESLQLRQNLQSAKAKKQQKQKEAEEQRLLAEQRRKQIVLEAEITKETLCKIALEKACEFYGKKEYSKCGALAGAGIEVIKDIQNKNVGRLKSFGKNLCKLAISKNPLIWTVITPSQIEHVDFSPNGEIIASALKDHSVRLWNVATMEEIAVLKGHTNHVTCVKWSPNGEKLASGSIDKTIRIWDVCIKKQISLLSNHEDAVTAISWDKEGKTLASGSVDKTIRLWDMKHSQQIAVFTHIETISNLHWNPIEKDILAFSSANAIRIWKVTEEKANIVLSGHTSSIKSLCWSPNGKNIASASRDRTIRIWDVATCKTISVLEGHSKWVVAIAWSPDSNMLASSSAHPLAKEGKASIRIWDSETKKQIYIWHGHNNDINTLSWRPDSKMIVSASDDLTIRLWAIEKNKPFTLLKEHADEIVQVLWSPDGKILASASDDLTIRLWDISTKKEIRSLIGHQEYITSIAWHPHKQILASSSWDKTIRLWDITTGNLAFIIPKQEFHINSVSWHPQAKMIAFICKDYICLWDVSNLEPICIFHGHSGNVTSICWSPDGKILASASLDQTIRLWDVSSKETINILCGHTKEINSVAWSPDGSIIASASLDKTVRLWQASSKKPIGILLGHTDDVTTICWSPDSKCLTSASSDQTIRLWDVPTSKQISILEGHKSSIESVCWSPDGRMLASGSRDKSIFLWDFTSARFILKSMIKQQKLPGWFKEIIEKPEIIEVNDPSFNILFNIPDHLLEYALENEPKIFIEKLLAMKVTATFGFEDKVGQ